MTVSISTERVRRVAGGAIALALVLIVVGVQIWVVGIVADLIAVNRRLLEEAVERQRIAGSPRGPAGE